MAYEHLSDEELEAELRRRKAVLPQSKFERVVRSNPKRFALAVAITTIWLGSLITRLFQ